MSRTILVTGGAGFIGSHIVDRLLALGHRVVIIDDFSTGKDSNVPDGVEVHRIDIRAPELRALVATVAPDVVLHLAAQIDVRVSVADPILDADVNILGTLNVAEAARASGARKLVVASSGGCVYGDDAPLPIVETTQGRPASPYGISKRVLHDYLGFYADVHGLEHVVLALSNVCGPRQDPHGEAGVVAIFIRAMLDGRPTTIYGDGSQTRDFVYVGDVADAFIRAMDAGSGVYNIGTGVETSVNELWKLCASAAAYDGDPAYAPARAGELARNALDTTKAYRELGWAPAVVVRDAIRMTAEHIATH